MPHGSNPALNSFNTFGDVPKRVTFIELFTIIAKILNGNGKIVFNRNMDAYEMKYFLLLTHISTAESSLMDVQESGVLTVTILK